MQKKKKGLKRFTRLPGKKDKKYTFYNSIYQGSSEGKKEENLLLHNISELLL